MPFQISGQRNIPYLFRLEIPENIDDFDENEQLELIFKQINKFKHNDPDALDPWECNFWVQIAVNVSCFEPDPELLEFYRNLLGSAGRLFGVEDIGEIDQEFWRVFAIMFSIWTGQWPVPRKLQMQCGHVSTAVTSDQLQEFCAACSIWTDDAYALKSSR